MINPNFEKLENNYLFADIARRVHDFKSENPESVLISMGIGDVTLPLAPAVVKALESASREQGEQGSFHGYGPYEGYDFLRETISARYAGRGISLSADEIFVGDGAKNDLGSVLSIFSSGAHVVIPDPVYPAYLDSNVLAGNDITFVSGCAANKYLPDPPDYAADLAYICSPNNPTGAVYDREGLGRWVHWANGCGAVLLFDAAYEGFVRNTFYPRSIFEIDGA
ncbi:MAG: aminotransferase class I/II-fold pyridoxal phosphate-dependent enzyme, partial [Oscillospiraceae bacterium]